MTAPHPLIEKLRALREEAELSRRKTTRLAGLGEGAVLGWETGRYGPTVHGLEAYAAVFGLRVELVPDPDAQVTVLPADKARGVA